MVALLAVGDALLVQARDKDIVSGGDVVVLPEGVDPEVLKVGGVTAMFLSIPNARYLVRQVLLGPRFETTIASVSPEITDKLVYVRTREGISAVLASADLPSLSQATGSALAITSPAWVDNPPDRAWVTPDPTVWLQEIDQFHPPPGGREARSWAEWWYFNFSAPGGFYGYLTFAVDRDQQALVRVAMQLPGGRRVQWAEHLRATALPLGSNTFQAGAQSVTLGHGTYHIHLSRPPFLATLEVRPIPGLNFPPLERQVGTFRSGYVVPALRAVVSGSVRVGTEHFTVNGIGYHDHNWGLWQAVTWEWGTASNSELALLAGLIRHPALRGEEQFLSLYAVNQGHPGLLATFRATPPMREDWHPGPRLRGMVLSVPRRLHYRAINDAADWLEVEIAVADVLASEVDAYVFLQIRGRYRIRGQVTHRPLSIEMDGFAETFIPRPRTR